ncbi:hypothetical protein [Streptomyces nanshensis]|uniref:Uncharacterized protein n=1 Tax=Streptomyces nanshensis TaxID=518642 RepID=A0A1E7LAI9_9ACTN|nr:hypothetical protein [Streptomyces nanshensis]OEV13227.1 hypothetical protein AN218_04575 [Streptomyces nanshensis]
MQWIMAKATKPGPETPTYAEGTHPSRAEACVLADGFEDLFAVLIAWQNDLMADGEYITAYAMPAVVTQAGYVAAETLAAWDEGDERAIRLDYEHGGWIKVAPDHEARPKGRPPFPPALEAPKRRKEITR